MSLSSKRSPSDGYVSNDALLQIGSLFGVESAIVTKLLPFLLRIFRRYPGLSKAISFIIASVVPATLLYRDILSVSSYIISFFTTSAVIGRDDDLSTQLVKWIRKRKTLKIPTTVHGIKSIDYARQLRDTDWDSPAPEPDDDELEHYVITTPVKWSVFFWKRRFILHTEAQDQSYQRLWCLGRSKAPLLEILDEVIISQEEIDEDEGEQYTSISQINYDLGTWIRQCWKPSRSLESVDLPQQDKELLIKDISDYLDPDTQAWYKKKNIPHRRGYLFWGPPGNGKSSLAAAIAGHFGLNIYVLTLSDSRLTDSALCRYFAHLDSVPALLLIEDIDSAGMDRETMGKKRKKGKDGKITQETTKSTVTLSGLLNALDGVAAPQGYIVIMTTNTPETLDDALTRAGRCNVKFEFKNAGQEQMRGMFMRLFEEEEPTDTVPTESEHPVAEQVPVSSAAPSGRLKIVPSLAGRRHNLGADRLEELAGAFANRVPEHEFSGADIQEYLISRFGDPQRAVDEAEEWVKEMREKKNTKKVVEELNDECEADDGDGGEESEVSVAQW